MGVGLLDNPYVQSVGLGFTPKAKAGRYIAASRVCFFLEDFMLPSSIQADRNGRNSSTGDRSDAASSGVR